VFHEAQLRSVLKNYAFYYYQVRTHLSLKRMCPIFGARKSSAALQQYRFSAAIINLSGFSF